MANDNMIHIVEDELKHYKKNNKLLERIIEIMENILDACEDVADTVQSIVTKSSR